MWHQKVLHVPYLASFSCEGRCLDVILHFLSAHIVFQTISVIFVVVKQSGLPHSEKPSNKMKHSGLEGSSLLSIHSLSHQCHLLNHCFQTGTHWDPAHVFSISFIWFHAYNHMSCPFRAGVSWIQELRMGVFIPVWQLYLQNSPHWCFLLRLPWKPPHFHENG